MNGAPSISGKTRVLHVIPRMGMGGAAQVVADLLRLLDATGEFAVGLCVLGRPDPFDADAPPPALMGYLNSHLALGHAPDTVRTVRELRRVISRFNPHILHSHLWLGDVFSGFALRDTTVRHISHQHGAQPSLLECGVRPAMRRAATRLALSRSRPLFLCVSRATGEFTRLLHGAEDSRRRIVYNGIPAQRIRPVRLARTRRADDPLVVGAAGRFVPEKGIENLLRAAATLESSGCPVEVRLAGSGSSQSAYRELAATLGIAHRLTLSGLLRDLQAFYAGLDVFVLPTVVSEGLPISVLEAMAAGVPVVATDVGGTREAVVHNETGILVPPQDAQAIAAALRRLASADGPGERLAGRAQDRVREVFTAERMADQVADVYRHEHPGVAPV